MNIVIDLLIPVVGAAFGFFILKKVVDAKRKSQISSPTGLSAKPFGVEIAEQVVTGLESDRILAFTHREYCGMGMAFIDGEYLYSEVFDGQLPSSKELATWTYGPNMPERLVFTERAEFVAWLATQSDLSLSLQTKTDEHQIDTQRVTLMRIEQFLRTVNASN